MVEDNPFADYPTYSLGFKGAVVRLPAAPTPRIKPDLRRDLRDFLLDAGWKEGGNCPRCTMGEKFTVPAGNFNFPGNAPKMPVCTACDRVDLWPDFEAHRNG